MRPPFPLGLDGTEARRPKGKNFLLNYDQDEIQGWGHKQLPKKQIKGIY